MSLNRAL